MSKRTNEMKRLAALPPKPAPVRRDFSPEEIMELRELQRAVDVRRYEAAQVRRNTALVPRGQEVAAELDALARLLENAKNQWVSLKLLECGYAHDAKCSINLSTGAITLTDEPGNDTAA